MLKFLSTYYGSLQGEPEKIFNHNVLVDPFEYMEDISEKKDYDSNVNVSNKAYGNEGQNSHKLGNASPRCHEFINNIHKN